MDAFKKAMLVSQSGDALQLALDYHAQGEFQLAAIRAHEALVALDQLNGTRVAERGSRKTDTIIEA